MKKPISKQDNRKTPLGAKLLEHAAQYPDQPLLLNGTGPAPDSALEADLRDLLEQLEAGSTNPYALTVLSNFSPDLNPFSGLCADSEPQVAGLCENLVRLLGPGLLHEWSTWPEHAVLLSARAVQALAAEDTTRRNAVSKLKAAGGGLLFSDSLFLLDPGSSLFEQVKLEPHEERRPAAWGALCARLDQWLRKVSPDSAPQLAVELENFRAGELPVTLHVTHSWGGGIAQWIKSFIDADHSGINLQLRSEGPQTGAGCGQRYSLYLSNQLEAPVASWWLQPPIRSTGESNPAYSDILRQVFDRYGVGRLVVSSLIGHSLDALTSGLPTIQVLHDFYPRWPLLGIHPGPYLRDGQNADLSRALEDHRLLSELDDRDAQGWEDIGRRWRECIVNWGVRVAAPSRSVADLMRELDPAWQKVEFEIIPHGLPDLPGTAEVLPREREDGLLRLVIPGRIQEGKGQRLLLEALPKLRKYAHVYLLGAGKDGEVFFGKSGVDVIIQYRRDQLKDILSTIGPHIAGLLSVVPETFSYTLSEMQQLNVPVIATRVGSLAERIVDGKTGWLIEPDADSLLERVREIAAHRDQLTAMREHLAGYDLPNATRMVEKYEKICGPRPAPRIINRHAGLRSAQLAALSFQNTESGRQARSLSERAKQLQSEVEKRSAWAEKSERGRKDEERRRIEWVGRLENEIQALNSELHTTGMRLQSARESLEHETQIHQQTSGELERLTATHEWVLSTHSWRLTRPFRVAGRVFANLSRAGAWNPLKWPLLLSQVSRIIRTRGLSGAIARAQLTQGELKADAVDMSQVEEIGDTQAPQQLPSPAEPRVSVIIPVYNKWAYTAACLRSLAEIPCKASFEVIVVDDQSSDETAGCLQEVEGLVYLRNDENVGFIGSCNRGAEQARGEFVLFLNNDTQVLDGWLDALLETFERHPDTGLAGARLVYPDGSLQEAGGMVFNDGSGWNYGKGDNADLPEYQQVREADYVSGACIVLKRELFRELGGFDSHYAPAYYEDTDLAFRIREQGLKVRVQGASTIVHHEGITSGTDLESGAKSYQVVNRDKFLQRWQEQLEKCSGPIIDPTDRSEIRRARDHHLKGRVLIVDAYTPEPDQDSGSLRLCYLMDCFMALGYGVTFLPDNRAHAGRYTRELQQAGVETIYDPWVGSMQRFFDERGSEFDFIMVSRHYVASKYTALLRRHCPRARFIFDTVDLHYLREERLADLENSLPLKRTAAQTRRSELAVINAADATLVVSPVEKAVLKEAAPDAQVHVISNVHKVVGSRRPFSDRKDIFFVGGYQHPPNIDAATWFVGQVWPIVHAALPEMVFHLIGSKAPEQVRGLNGNGVHFHGFVESLEPWLDECRLSVAPLRYGAGIKGKVNISMSRGQPVVATSVAVEGMFAKPGHDILVADSAADFAAEIIRLYQDEALWNHISAAGLENVRRYFSVETARLGLRELIKSFD